MNQTVVTNFEKPIGCYSPSVQELIVIDDVLSSMTGIEGRYILIKAVRGKNDDIAFLVDPSMDLALQELAKRIFPLCKSFLLISQFVESRSQFQSGLVNHAFSAALRALLLDYQAMVSQLEHQFRLGRLSLQGLWFYCQPMMRSMQALSTVIQKASVNNISGSAVLNLLQSQVPPSENSKLMSFGSNHHYLECIKAAYNFASGELLNLIKEKYDLTGRLRSIKHYLLLDQGDFLVHFMDIARDELAKKPDEVSVEKLQSLLDLALRTTAAAADPFHEGLTCERCSLLRRLGTFNDLEVTLRNSGDNDLEEPVSITSLETFSLSYKVHWPLSIVLSRKALTKYQLLFRFLFHCKHVDRQLCGAWQVHQVIEPNWHLMYNRLQSANSIDEVIQHHDFFLDKCLRECLLLLPELLKKVERLKSMCLQYAAATQWLISSSIELHNPEEPIDDSKGLNKAKWKSGQVLKSTTRNMAVTDSVLKFEKEFNTELQSLGSILSNNSQAEPYLSHLAQWLLGVKSEKNDKILLGTRQHKKIGTAQKNCLAFVLNNSQKTAQNKRSKTDNLNIWN
ncbi:Gamma-tubulin complex component 2 [Glycine max]|nr:Gamma-tubulin complex component 2 [Glycine max]